MPLFLPIFIRVTESESLTLELVYDEMLMTPTPVPTYGSAAEIEMSYIRPWFNSLILYYISLDVYAPYPHNVGLNPGDVIFSHKQTGDNVFWL